ncbi:hypothetical protein BC827DRAFT_1159524 [Russula dissimulans]|nr:hypothetical protein BC827DRAFT_1159524 [Russula dissimulans]
MAMPANWQTTMQGQPDSEHKAKMAKDLSRYIQDSLRGVPSNLPELKGLRAKLPDAYEGEDDFNQFESWLQGLLRYFKLQCLTGKDRDGDRVLVAGSCLKGWAEWWFNHEVECPQHITHDWMFESVVLGLYRAFITTTTAQQVVQKYAQVQFSQDSGVNTFHRELLMWAGRLTQYQDAYSIKRRLLNGLPIEYQNHLALFDGISTKHSLIDNIVQCT